jgi:hypothetical protein
MLTIYSFNMISNDKLYSSLGLDINEISWADC